MEAGRFELPSCIRSSAASTCVAHRLMFPVAGRSAAHAWMILLKFRPTPEGAPLDYPGFAIPVKPPRAGFPTGTAGRNRPTLKRELEVTQQERSCCSQLELSRVFYQEPEDLGTRPRGHPHNRNQSPPVVYNLHISRGTTRGSRASFSPPPAHSSAHPPSPDTAPGPPPRTAAGGARHPIRPHRPRRRNWP